MGGFSDEQIAGGATGLSFVDASGGPFIGIGTPLNKLHADLPPTKIAHIESNDEGIFLHV